jgi:hypothetical protein
MATAGGGYVEQADQPPPLVAVHRSIDVGAPGLTVAQHPVADSSALMNPPDGTVLTPQSTGASWICRALNSLVAGPLP